MKVLENMLTKFTDGGSGLTGMQVESLGLTCVEASAAEAPRCLEQHAHLHEEPPHRNLEGLLRWHRPWIHQRATGWN